MTTKTLHYEDIGQVQLTKRKGAKNIKIMVSRDKGVRVTVPYIASYREAEKFIESKISWIQEMQEKHAKPDPRVIIFDRDTEFKTRSHVLEMIPCEMPRARTRIAAGKIKVYYPEIIQVAEDPDLQKFIRLSIEEAMKREAHLDLPFRLQSLAAQHGLKHGKLSIRRMKTLWGSCASNNNISLSVHLMRLPDELIDYVILHELTHTIYKNHSPAFWSQLSVYLGQDAKMVDKRLKPYSLW